MILRPAKGNTKKSKIFCVSEIFDFRENKEAVERALRKLAEECSF